MSTRTFRTAVHQYMSIFNRSRSVHFPEFIHGPITNWTNNIVFASVVQRHMSYFEKTFLGWTKRCLMLIRAMGCLSLTTRIGSFSSRKKAQSCGFPSAMTGTPSNLRRETPLVFLARLVCHSNKRILFEAVMSAWTLSNGSTMGTAPSRPCGTTSRMFVNGRSLINKPYKSFAFETSI